MPYIIVSNDEREIERRELRREILIGRSSRCDIMLDDKLVSRQHCRITPLEDTWLIEDRGSHNGTFVNGIQVKRHLLADGDRVEVGDVLIEFHTGSLSANRPVDAHEARMRAELLREVDAISEETMTGVRPRPRPLPLPQVQVAAPERRMPLDRDAMHGSPAAFARPMPSPIVSDKSNPAPPPADPPRSSLLGRLLGRHRGE